MDFDKICNDIFESAKAVFQEKTYQRFANKTNDKQIDIILKTALVAGGILFAAALVSETIATLMFVPVTLVAFSYFNRQADHPIEKGADFVENAVKKFVHLFD